MTKRSVQRSHTSLGRSIEARRCYGQKKCRFLEGRPIAFSGVDFQERTEEIKHSPVVKHTELISVVFHKNIIVN